MEVALSINSLGQTETQRFTQTLNMGQPSSAAIDQCVGELVASVVDQKLTAAIAARDVERRNEESRWLVEDALRMRNSNQPYSAAARFEAAYALNGDPALLNDIIESLGVCLTNHSRVQIPPKPVFGEPAVPTEKWLEVFALANYRLTIYRKSHQHATTLPGWLFRGGDNAWPSILTNDFLINPATSRVVFTLHQQQQPEAYQQLAQYFQAVDELVYSEFANDARWRLSGDDLRRFNQALDAERMDWLTSAITQHALPDWPQKFLRLFGDILLHDHRLSYDIGLFRTIENLPPAEQQQCWTLVKEEAANAHSRTGYIARYLQFRHQREQTEFQYDTEFLDQVQRLNNDLVDAMVREDIDETDNPSWYSWDQFGGVRFRTTLRRKALGNLRRAACVLVPETMDKRQCHVRALMRLMNRNVHCASAMMSVFHPSYYYYLADDVETMQQLIRIPQGNNFGLDEADHKALLQIYNEQLAVVQARSLDTKRPMASAHLPTPWEYVREVSVPSHHQIHASLVAVGVHGRDIFIAWKPSLGRQPGELELHVCDPESPELGGRSFEYTSDYFGNYQKVSSLAVTDKYAFLTSNASGVYVFPWVQSAW